MRKCKNCGGDIWAGTKHIRSLNAIKLGKTWCEIIYKPKYIKAQVA